MRDGRRPNPGHEQGEACSNCKGTGEVEHRCTTFETVETLWKSGGEMSRESLAIKICPDCESVFKVRSQFDRGTGSDNIWLQPGEERRGYSFSEEDAEAYRKQWREQARSD